MTNPWIITAEANREKQRIALNWKVNGLNAKRQSNLVLSEEKKTQFEAEYQSALLELNAFEND